jgi:hypothetical protein
MVRVHKAARVNEPSELAGDTTEADRVGVPVVVVLDDPAPAISLRDHVMDRARKLFTRRPCHPDSIAVVEADD